jgi:response regulator RpfG family c-di-GMP phosphodiesterase
MKYKDIISKLTKIEKRHFSYLGVFIIIFSSLFFAWRQSKHDSHFDIYIVSGDSNILNSTKHLLISSNIKISPINKVADIKYKMQETPESSLLININHAQSENSYYINFITADTKDEKPLALISTIKEVISNADSFKTHKLTFGIMQYMEF